MKGNVWGGRIGAFFGPRVIKTAAATLAAILTATALGVPNPLSAGLLAILGVETTRWRGLKVAFARFCASVLGLLVAMVLFAVIGFHFWVLSLYVLISFPLLARFGLKDGIVTGSVIVFHLYGKQELTSDALLGEVYLLLIGLGWATAFNLLYMPKETDKLAEYRNTVENAMSAIFAAMATHLREPDTVWSGEELIAADEAVEQGIALAERARENRLIPQDEPWQLYFHMRREQLDSVKLMMESVALVSRKVPQAESIAVLLDRLSLDVKSEFYEGETERMLEKLAAGFKSLPLPATRDEFEIRASLLQLSRELRRCLTIAKRSKKQKSASETAII